jgi:cytochrome c oxidase assembly factor CtaG
MHPLALALLSGWEWRLEILAVLVPLAALYTLGWLRLRRQSVHGRLATWPRLAAYLGGMVILATSLMSPIDRLGGQLFFMHMVQHMLTVMYAAPLLLLGNPFPFVLWALPATLRRLIAGQFTEDTLVRRGLTAVTRPGVTWLVFLTVFLGWHDPNAYNAALYHGWVHDVQHISFFVAALLFWYPVIEAGPRLHRRFPAWGKIAYLIGAVPPNMFIGVSIAFAGDVLYSYYLSAPRVWGFTVMQDQQLSGAIMWIQGSEMYILVALIVLALLARKKQPTAEGHALTGPAQHRGHAHHA